MAEAAYREHLAAKGPDLKIGNDHELAQHIEKKIAEDGYSPAAVLVKLRNRALNSKRQSANRPCILISTRASS